MLDLFPYLQPKTLYLNPSNDETVIQLAALTFFSNISSFGMLTFEHSLA